MIRNIKRNSIFILSIFIMSFHFAFSKDDIIKENFQLSAIYNNDSINLSLGWYLDRNDIEEAIVYIKQGKPSNTIKLEDFQFKQDITNNIADTLYSDRNGLKVYGFSAHVEYEMKEEIETVVLKIKFKNGVYYLSYPSYLKRAIDDPNKSFVYFTNFAPIDTLIAKNSELNHDFDAVANNKNVEIKYKIIEALTDVNYDISGLYSIDEKTGKFQFKSEYEGRYSFTIQAYFQANGAIYSNNQVIGFRVDKCEVLPIVVVKLVNQDNQPVANSDLFLFTIPMNSHKDNMFTGVTDENGVAKFYVSTGSYYLQYYSRNGISAEQYYNNAFRFEDAETIAVSECQSVKEIVFKVRTNLDSNNLFALKFTKLPPMKQGEKYKIGTEIKFSIKAELGSKENAKIRYSIQGSDENMKIDSETGEFSWTPNKAGEFFATFVAQGIDDDYTYPIYFTQSFFVSSCENPATLNVSFVTKDGKPVINDFHGVARLFKLATSDPNQNDSLYMRIKTSDEVKIEQSFAQFKLDEGEYVLVVNSGNNFFWYENARDLKEATIIKVACGEVKNITMILDEHNLDETVNVSGYCLTKNGQVIKSKIVFEGDLFNNNGLKKHFVTHIENNDNGFYSVELPKGFQFIAYAMNGNSNAPLYYNQTYNRFDATYIYTKEDLRDINFIFEDHKQDSSHTKNFAKVSGNVISTSNQLVTNSFVVALRVDKNRNPNTNTGLTYLANDGSFEFNLEMGTYVFLAIPQSNLFIPGFYVENAIASMKWEDATIVNLFNVNNKQITITLQDLEKKPGIARLNGEVTSFDSKANIDNANILLLDEDTAIEYTSTNYDGVFDFPNVADGEYKLVVNKMGYQSYESYVSLDKENPLSVNIELEPVSAVSSVEIDNDIVINVYPNPSIGLIKVQNLSNEDFDKYEVLDLSGALIYSSSFQNGMQVDVSNLVSGKYFIKLSNNKTSTLNSFTISK